jgi:hypothetical protein
VEHIAVDLGGRESQLCVRSSDGTVLEEKRVATSRVSGYLAKRQRSRVVLETCAEAFAVADGHGPCLRATGERSSRAIEEQRVLAAVQQQCPEGRSQRRYAHLSQPCAETHLNLRW